MKKTLKFLVSTALIAAFAAPMHASSAHLHGPGYGGWSPYDGSGLHHPWRSRGWSPYHSSGLYHPWRSRGWGRGYGRGHGGLSGGIGFSMGAGGFGRGWGRGYSRPYWAHHRYHARNWRGAPYAMTAPQTTSDNGSY